MHFDLNEDQEMLKAVAERFIADRYDTDRRRAYLASELGFSAANWAHLGKLGLIATAFSEAGGLAATDADLAIIFEALGRGGFVEPLAGAAVLAGGLFEATASAELKADWLDALVVGERRLAVAHRETQARQNFSSVQAKAEFRGGCWHLDGVKSLVPAGIGVDAYIVSARLDGDDPDAVGLFLVVADAPGLTAQSFRLIDGALGCSLALRDVPVSAAMLLGTGLEPLARAECRAAIANNAEALGIMETMFAATLDFLRTRRQFGVPLASFQALQHRMVAQFAVLEQARSLLLVAVTAGPAARQRAVAGARAFIAEHSIALGHEMIQLHGAMGVTDELPIGHAHKRLVWLSRFPDDADAALDAYAP